MSRATIEKKVEVTHEIPALTCDLCGFTFSVGEAVGFNTDRDHLGNYAIPVAPVGSGKLVRALVDSPNRSMVTTPTEVLDLCVTCMESLWREVTRRREERLSASSQASGAAPRE